MTFMDVLEWSGAAFVVAGYYAYGKALLVRGSVLSMVGCVLFFTWGLNTGNAGVATLNVVIFVSVLVTLCRILLKPLKF